MESGGGRDGRREGARPAARGGAASCSLGLLQSPPSGSSGGSSPGARFTRKICSFECSFENFFEILVIGLVSFCQRSFQRSKFLHQNRAPLSSVLPCLAWLSPFFLASLGCFIQSAPLLSHCHRPQVCAIDSACERLAFIPSHQDQSNSLSQDRFRLFCFKTTTLAGRSSTASCWRPSRRSRASSPPTGTDSC